MIVQQVRFSIILLIFFILDYNNGLYASTQDINFDNLIEKSNYFKNRNSDSVIFYANKAYLLADKTSNPNQKLDALSILVQSNIYSGNFIKAQVYCDTANKILQEHNLRNRKAEALINLGNVYLNIGMSSEALKLFYEAESMFNENPSSYNKADLYYYIAIANYDIGEINKTQEYLESAISIAKSNNINYLLFSSYLLLSNTFSTLDSTQKYLSLADQLITIYPLMVFEKIVLRNNQALLSKSLGNLKQCRVQYLEAMALAKDNGFRYYLANLYNNFAYLLMVETKYDSAKYYLDQAFNLAESIKNLELKSDIYDSYSDYYEAIGDYKNSLIYTNLFIEKRDQFRDQQKIQETLILSAVFETEQKEKLLLQQENQIFNLWILALGALAFFIGAIGLGGYFRQKFKLSKSNLESIQKDKALEIADALIKGQDSERKRLASNLHDGPVARLSLLGFIIDGSFRTNPKYIEVANSIKEINQEIREISHRMLPTHLEKLGLTITIQNMVSSINKTGEFTIDFESNLTSRLSVKLESNLYYLTYELINNSIKHSGCDSIFVQLILHDKHIQLSVENNGKLFDYKNLAQGNGVNNIKLRVEYLGGSFEINSDENITFFLIEIPTVTK